MMKDLLSQLSTKVAAGALGAVLALGGLGAAGIGPVSLASHESDEHECVELDELAENFDENIVVCEVAEEDSATADEEGDDVPADDAEAVDDADEDAEESEESEEVTEGELPPVPTTTSEAAQIHAFDEACGNHGMYVSFFAQMGFEPPCALLVRAGEEPDEDLTKQERKKAALALRKECKARAKAGDPCTAEEFMPTEGEEQDTSQTDSEEQDAATTATAEEGETSTDEADAGKGKGKDKAQSNEKSKAKGGKGGPKGGKGNK